MRGTRAKRLLRDATNLRWVDDRGSLVKKPHKNGMYTLRYRQGSLRRIYQDLKKEV